MKNNDSVDLASKRPRKAPAKSDAHVIHERLRRDILTGALQPGDVLNTVHLAREYEVSRMPVREALRMLQIEGLVDAPYQYRMRVKAVTAEEVDAVYATWILMQSLAVGLTVTQTTPAELETLREAVHALNQVIPTDARSRTVWNRLHIAYSKLVVKHAGSQILANIEACWTQSERARLASSRMGVPAWQASEAEHNLILAAFEQQSAEKAVELTCTHLARVALAVIEKIDPDFEPKAIGQAVRMTVGRAAAARLMKPAASKPRRSRKTSAPA
jgi:DNA-binding GntR family transcriptional regulator